MATGARTVGKACLRSHSAEVLVHAERHPGPRFTGTRHLQPMPPSTCPGFPMISSSHTCCSCATLRVHRNEEQSSGAEPSTAREVESAQGHRRRLRAGLRQISSQGTVRAQKRAALSEPSKAIYRGPLDERTPHVLSYLLTSCGRVDVSRRCQP